VRRKLDVAVDGVLGEVRHEAGHRLGVSSCSRRDERVLAEFALVFTTRIAKRHESIVVRAHEGRYRDACSKLRRTVGEMALALDPRSSKPWRCCR
jgi:hypothetical protein